MESDVTRRREREGTGKITGAIMEETTISFQLFSTFFFKMLDVSCKYEFFHWYLHALVVAIS